MVMKNRSGVAHLTLPVYEESLYESLSASIHLTELHIHKQIVLVTRPRRPDMVRSSWVNVTRRGNLVSTSLFSTTDLGQQLDVTELELPGSSRVRGGCLEVLAS